MMRAAVGARESEGGGRMGKNGQVIDLEFGHGLGECMDGCGEERVGELTVRGEQPVEVLMDSGRMESVTEGEMSKMSSGESGSLSRWQTGGTGRCWRTDGLVVEEKWEGKEGPSLVYVLAGGCDEGRPGRVLCLSCLASAAPLALMLSNRRSEGDDGWMGDGDAADQHGNHRDTFARPFLPWPQSPTARWCCWNAGQHLATTQSFAIISSKINCLRWSFVSHGRTSLALLHASSLCLQRVNEPRSHHRHHRLAENRVAGVRWISFPRADH